MAQRPSSGRQIRLRLIHDGAQPGRPLDEPLQFGLQDAKGEVHPGTAQTDGTLAFDLRLEVREDGAAGQPVFRGAFAHGRPAGRFLYLSWKREGAHEHPWEWRIKVPLSGIDWAAVRLAERPRTCLAANVVGRRPHASDTVNWQIITLHGA